MWPYLLERLPGMIAPAAFVLFGLVLLFTDLVDGTMRIAVAVLVFLFAAILWFQRC